MNILKDILKPDYFINKNILITGGTGTLGNILIEFFLTKSNCNRICIFSRDEFKQHQMKIKFKDYENKKNLRFFIGDVRDIDRIEYACTDIDIVFHAAALKQVDAIEYNPMEAIKTNVLGTQNVVMACINKNVKQLVGVSTDKCVAPVNLYGATKLCLEKLIISGRKYSANKLNTCVLRYGNVIGSRGSVVPIFKNQKNEGKFTVTDKRMTRFTLTIQEACTFILNCSSIATGGEIFVPKLPKYTLPQLCKIINPDNEIIEIGLRSGEKLHESMIAEAESLDTWISKNFFVIMKNEKNKLDLIKNFNLKKNDKIFVYSSETAKIITDEELINQVS
jgi:UDP-N-acetylglucosamine 4,6-dehydratase/5-epimerase